MELCSYFLKLPGNFFELPASWPSSIVTSTLVWCIARRQAAGQRERPNIIRAELVALCLLGISGFFSHAMSAVT